jgi:GxxExxY protein
LHAAITEQVLGGFFFVFKELGSGFVEGVYAAALALELRARGRRVDTEVPVSVHYRGTEVGRFRADAIVENAVLLELKAADRLTASCERQLINYLAATNLEVGLLLNFGPRPDFRRFLLTNDRKKHL